MKKWREERPEGPEAHGAPRNPAQRFKDKNTRKSAIEAMCWYCMGGTEEKAEGARASIRDCTAPDCPLYDWRPYK